MNQSKLSNNLPAERPIGAKSVTTPIQTEITAMPAAAWRSPRSPAKAATTGPRSAGKSRSTPVNLKLQSSSAVTAGVLNPTNSTTVEGRIAKASARKKSKLACTRRMRADRRVNTPLTYEIFWVDIVQKFSKSLNLFVSLRAIFSWNFNSSLL